MNDKKDGAVRSVDARREDRRQAILDAAEALFLEQGFERVSVSAIVQRSGGSLATVYDLFGNKHGILHAVVDRRREESLKGMEEIGRREASAAEVLRLFAYRYHAFIMSPRTLAFSRLVIAESLANPSFGREFHRDLQLKFMERLAALFSEWTAAGKAAVDDPAAAAELYFASLLCDAPIKTMLGAPPEPTDERKIAWRLAPFLEHFKIV